MNSYVCRVFVNDIEVGSIPQSDYRKIVLEASEEIKSHFRLLITLQTLNITACLFKIFVRILRAAPVVLTAALLFCAYFESDQMAILLSAVQSSKSADAASILKNLSSIIFCTTSILVMGYSIAFDNTLGFVNQFDERKTQVVNYRVRSLLEVATEGRLHVEITKV